MIVDLVTENIHDNDTAAAADMNYSRLLKRGELPYRRTEAGVALLSVRMLLA